MKSYFIFINLICLAIQRDFKLLFKKLYNNNNENEKINIDYCKQINKNSFNYKKISIKNILNNKQKNDLNKYKYVYIPELGFFEKITLFPKSTIFFIPESILNNSSIYTNDYCIIKLDNKYEKIYLFIF
jgi:hypothetical protein